MYDCNRPHAEDQAPRRQKSQTALHKLNLDSMGTGVDCLGKSLDIDISAKRSMPIQPPPKKAARSHQIETMSASSALMIVSYLVRADAIRRNGRYDYPWS
jgi:hypothetical protein